MADGLEERLGKIDEKLSELEDFQLLNRLDIISLKDEVGRYHAGETPATGAPLPPGVGEKLQSFVEFSNKVDVDELPRIIGKVAAMRDEVEKIKLAGAPAQAGAGENAGMLAGMAKEIEDLKEYVSGISRTGDAQNYAAVLKSSIDEFRNSLKNELKASLAQVEAGTEGKFAGLRDELLGRNEELAKRIEQLDEIGKTVSQLEAGQRPDAKFVETAVRREAQVVRADIINELNDRFQNVEKIATSDVNAQMREVRGEAKDFEESVRKEFDKLGASVRDQVDSQSRHIGSLERELSDAAALRSEIEKLKKQAGAFEDLEDEIKTLKEHLSHVYFPGEEKTGQAKSSLDYMKSALTQLEVKVGAGVENKTAKVKDELSTRIQELANQLRQFDEIRKTLTQLEMKASGNEKAVGGVKQELQLLSSGQSGLSEKIDAVADEINRELAEKTDVKLVEEVMRKEVEIVKVAAINELNRRVDAIEKSVGGSIEAQLNDAKKAVEKSVMDSVVQKPDFKALEEGLYKEFDKLRSFLKDQTDTQAKHVDSMEKDLNAAKTLRNEVEKLRKQVGPGAEDAEALAKRIDALKTKEEWVETELLKVDLTPLYDKVKELENQMLKLNISMPVILE